MNPTSLADAKELATVVAAETADMPGEAIIFPPRGARVPGARPRPPAHSTRRFPFIGAVSEIIKDTKLHLGAQSCFFEDSGAYTGAVAASMVKSMGVTYILTGHSERRSLFMDDDTAVNKKTLKVLESGMIPVLCIGETKDEYDAGLCESVCAIQLAKDLAGVSAEDMKKIVIAYEPVARRVRRPGAFFLPRDRGRPTPRARRSGPSARASSAPRTRPRRCTSSSARSSRRCTTRRRPTRSASSTAAP